MKNLTAPQMLRTFYQRYGYAEIHYDGVYYFIDVITKFTKGKKPVYTPVEDIYGFVFRFDSFEQAGFFLAESLEGL